MIWGSKVSTITILHTASESTKMSFKVFFHSDADFIKRFGNVFQDNKFTEYSHTIHNNNIY